MRRTLTHIDTFVISIGDQEMATENNKQMIVRFINELNEQGNKVAVEHFLDPAYEGTPGYHDSSCISSNRVGEIGQVKQC
jgi:hypothetical protein